MDKTQPDPAKPTIDRMSEAFPALTGLLKQLSQEQKSPELALQAGRVAYALGHYDQAGHFWHEAYIAKPTDSAVQNCMGMLAFAQKDFVAAEDLFVRAVREDRKNRYALDNLLTIYNQTALLSERWLSTQLPTAERITQMRKDQEGFPFRPLISLIMPVYNPKPDYLRQCLDSVVAQTYPMIEFCIVDDASTDVRVTKLLRQYAATHRFVKLLRNERNMHIAGASNRAIQMATGDFLGFLDSDDALLPATLFECVKVLQERRDTDLIYTDSVLVGAEGEVKGLMLKPKWSPEFFLSTNYIVHFCLFSRSIVSRIGPFPEDEGHKGVQDVDIKAKLMDLTDKVQFIAKPLYLWRNTETSVASSAKAKNYVQGNAQRVFQEVLDRRAFPGTIEIPAVAERLATGIYKIRFKPNPHRRIAAIIFSRGKVKALAPFEKLLQNLPYPHLELCVFLPRGDTLATPVRGTSGQLYAWNSDNDVSAVVSQLEADYLLFLDPSAKPQDGGWLTELCGYLDLSPEIGAVGGKLISSHNIVSHGAYLLMKDLQILNEGMDNREYGHWFNNVIAHNVSAVSSSCMLTRKAVLVDLGGFSFERYQLYADVDYCLRLLQRGLRVVFNPWCTLLLEKDNDRKAAAQGKEHLLADYAQWFDHDPYYNPGFSSEVQFGYGVEKDVGFSIKHEIKYLKRPPIVPPETSPQSQNTEANSSDGKVVALRDFPSGHGFSHLAPSYTPRGLAESSQSGPLRINFVQPPAPKITGGPLAILEYANRLLDRGHEVTITTYPDLLWDGPSPFPWFNFRGKLIYRKLRGVLKGEPISAASSGLEEEEFLEFLQAKLIKAGGVELLTKFFLHIGGLATEKKKVAVDHVFNIYLKFAYLLEVMPDCDLNIATFWETAFPVFFSKKGKPVYFMQHYEDVFYPTHMDLITLKLGARASYALPMHKVANSSWLRDVMRKEYHQDVPFSNNGIEVSDFQPRAKESEKDGILRVVTYSRPEEWKGFCDAAAAMEQVRSKHSGRLEWHVFGYKNPHVPKDNTKIPYTYHENLSFRELADLYARCDIALCPSWYESFPLPPLEAMASGTATITTSYGTEDYAHNEKTALVVPPRDIPAMVAALERLIDDSELRQRLAAKGRTVAETFHWDAAVDRREAILRDIHEGRDAYDIFASAKTGLVDGPGREFERMPADLNIPDGTLIKSTSPDQPDMFLVDQGGKRHIIEGHIVEESGFRHRPVVELDPLVVARIPSISPIFSLADLPAVK